MNTENHTTDDNKELVTFHISTELAYRVEAGNKDFDWNAYIIGLIEDVTAS